MADIASEALASTLSQRDRIRAAREAFAAEQAGHEAASDRIEREHLRRMHDLAAGRRDA